ncbi:tagatose-bisphosphate aldolase noncatalytic subunit [Hydrogenispora ethanolica]|jgi:D-tagatose-1,6-bisphosphate aldolase subunit GatZ/KbaZ|uniref:Tagatose-bisphosphate aldolase noncatalytic subunit n=1 Tax=Hydrogenispora ethanolica TaxID=1082276 RepID=A0A4R1R0K4_HYDET|nr:D-tagatose-bisphosphate aldolase, class II, non-catalytic subunit [Hydrogenispora ethanolica]TCL58830.1 tagatose-bisphosphate aldolase noncatalytic subunit [Hydrogenispora ethanolica]
MKDDPNFFEHPLLKMIQQQKESRSAGIYSICSANRFVVEAAVKQAEYDHSTLLIEATSNQVNQFGGYTGLNPARFVAYIRSIAAQMDFPVSQIMLGGDHLGPNPWQNEAASTAMAKARDMVRDYVLAGFEKIHLDASMRCADDPGARSGPLADELIAERAAELCLAAESAYRSNQTKLKAPFYVIGTEVPVPGGAREAGESVAATRAEAARHTIEITKKAFYDRGLQSAWERVIALVVQPGVEFGDEAVFRYQAEKARELSQLIEAYPGLVYEAHSTDYQTRQALGEMVRDHFAILKVGPALTFAFREAVFALEMMESEWLTGKTGITLSRVRNVLDEAMLEQPGYWQKHYHGDAFDLQYARKYSFSDRSRYYWLHPRVNQALNVLLSNLSQTAVPLTLLDQFMPRQAAAVVQGKLNNHPIGLIHHKIMEVISTYASACGFGKKELELGKKAQ